LKIKNPNTKVLVVSDSKYVVDSVEKKMGFRLEKKDLLTGKIDLWTFFGCLQKIKSILNGLKGITIMFKTKGVMN
jgi:ribonuclease HI